MKNGFVVVDGMHIKANCFICEHLDYIDDESYEMQDGGYMCNKRENENGKLQRKHEDDLQRESYKKRAKSCCDIKNQ
jgi:hypothetical protein